MRTCEEYEALISAFIDGALEDGDREELMAHMAECPDCQAYFDDQIAIHDVLQGMEAQAPADFTAKVMEQVRQEPRQVPVPEQPEKKVVAFPYWRRFAAMAACCAVVVFAGFWAFGGQPDTGNVAADVATADVRGLPDEDTAADTPEDMPAVNGEVSGDTVPDTGSDATDTTDTALNSDSQGESNDAPLESEQQIAPPADDMPRSDDTPSVGQAVEPPADNGDAGGKIFPSMYSTPQTVMLTTDSQVAVTWVEETLGQSWQSGASYTLTEEQFAQVKALLEENGESFTEELPSKETTAGTVAGDSNTAVNDQGAVTYVLQAAP